MTVVEITERLADDDQEPPVSPHRALRVTYGMLLGVDDFETLVGYPRGKQMLHNAWLHGSGVVWGFKVWSKGRELRVGRGFGYDPIGRDLYLDSEWCLDVDAWLQQWRATEGAHAGSDDEVCVWLVASYRTCLAEPVPALANPCDLDRTHTDYSRFVESVHLELRKERPPSPPQAFHRVRVLLGLEEPDEADEACRAAIEVAADAPADERARRLLEELRKLAALDVHDLEPQHDPYDDSPNPFPVPAEHAAIVLAKVCIRPASTDVGEPGIDIDPTCRASLMPSSAIQELCCGFAPGLLSDSATSDAGGPRIDARSARWTNDGVAFNVRGRPLEASLRRQSIFVTSLTTDGWVRVEIGDIRLTKGTVHVELRDAATLDPVRIVVRGTGPAPVVGVDSIPLAGVVGGPPGSKHDGHDAVIALERRART